MLRWLARNLIRPWAVRYRRFMQAEMMDYLRLELAVIRAECRGDSSGTGTDMAALIRSVDAALLTIALNGGSYQGHSSSVAQSEDA